MKVLTVCVFVLLITSNDLGDEDVGFRLDDKENGDDTPIIDTETSAPVLPFMRR